MSDALPPPPGSALPPPPPPPAAPASGGKEARPQPSEEQIAANINNRGGQSLGLGVAMLALAAMPYASRPKT